MRLTALRLLIATLCLFLAGCGPGYRRNRLSDTVTFDGKPVPAGQIVFLPDAAAGNKGPAGSALIIDGRYDTGKNGMIGGPHVVRIDGSEKGNGNDRPGKMLFSGYELKEDLPNSSATRDFTVPASATESGAGTPENPRT